MQTYEWDGTCPYGYDADMVQHLMPQRESQKSECQSCEEKRRQFRRLQERMSICRMCAMFEAPDQYCTRAYMSVVELATIGEACPNGSWTDISDIRVQ